MTKINLDDLEKQIYDKRRDVKYDTKDLTTEYVSNKYHKGINYLELQETNQNNVQHNQRNVIYIPEYQRDFTWDQKRSSKLIESILLGLPIPFIFVAENKEGAWEIVDGSQRIRTIYNFINNKLQLIGLESLTLANNLYFRNLDSSRQNKLLDTTLRIIVLTEETTEDVKKDMFERINRGSDLLKPMEKRKGIYTGPFTDFIYNYVKTSNDYNELLKIDKWLENRQEREELLLRFFALIDDKIYDKGLSTGIAQYLDSFLERQNNSLQKLDDKKREEELNKYRKQIEEVVSIVKKLFPYGFRHRHNPQTKRSIFEAISVGVWLAINDSNEVNQSITPEDLKAVLISPDFQRYTHGINQAHKKESLRGRIYYIKNYLLQGN